MPARQIRRWSAVTGLAGVLLLLSTLPLTAQQAVTPTPVPQGTPTPAPFAGLAPDLFQRARAELNAQDYESALLDFSLFLALNPDYSQAWFGQSLSYLSTEQPERALESMNRALDTAQDNAGYRAALLSARAQIYMALENQDAALADLSAAIDVNPSAQSRADRARLYVQQGEYEAALVDLNAALALSPDDASLLVFRAFVQNQRGDQAAAGLDYARYVNAIGQNVSRNDLLVPGQASFVNLEEGVVQVFQFEGRAGQLATVIAEGRPGDTVDPLLVLAGPDGQPLAGDDDSGGELSPLIRAVPLPATGTYTVLLTHGFGGSTGQVAVAVQLDNGPAPEATAEATPEASPTPGR